MCQVLSQARCLGICTWDVDLEALKPGGSISENLVHSVRAIPFLG